jgi:Tfp pilus assembly protein PilF
MRPSHPSHCRRGKRTNRGGALPWAWLPVASLLLAIVLGTSQPLPAQPAELRTVTMRLAADDTYRAQPNWEANLRATVATVSAIYERNFQIRFVILDIVPWTTGGLTAERSLLTKLAADVPIGQADVVVAFVNQCERFIYGRARLFGRFITVTTGCYEITTVKDFAPPEVVLSHELAHLFGVFHPARNTVSVMLGGPADKFDDQAIRVIRLMRTLDFSRGVAGVDRETRRTWSAIYAEGHARDEPNPLAGAIFYEGWTMLRSGRMSEGETAFQEAIKLDPSFAEPHAGLGFLYVARGQLEDAARELRAAKELDFRLVPAREELGLVLFVLGKNEEALWEFREVLRVDPRLVRASSGLGMTLLRLGRVDEAISAYDEALRLAPSNAHALYGRGLAKRKKGDLPGSDADMAAARTIAPQVGEDYAAYGVRP